MSSENAQPTNPRIAPGSDAPLRQDGPFQHEVAENHERPERPGQAEDAQRPEHTDRDAAPQFVLPLVVRIEKSAPPSRTDALETAARAVLTLLGDERSTGEGEWARAVRDWQDARIRKVVRRARGAEWRKASALPGITVEGRECEVRVFPPVPLDGWPKELAKLQVSGTDLEDPEPPAPPEPGVPVLWLSPDVEMSAGKAMAQAGHGAQLAWWELSDAERTAWASAGPVPFALAVRSADAERWAGLVSRGLPVVRDAGFTEIEAGSRTVIADHPALYP
ncbi:peptidyl-tRNA hydrolase [Streptomyces sp. NPDC005963]|uniref:peptidyl-tRNA hydrolase n=1 Tax=Streptomyces sp. NPDC005963 TaxID=3156721 RepID=UPI0033C13832